MKSKFYLFAGLFLMLTTACQNGVEKKEDVSANEQSANAELGNGQITFTEEAYDFGEVKEGVVVDHVFKFSNTGTEPIIVNRVTTSCGCTTPKYTSTPVAPGKEGEITVRFDSKGQSGKQQKLITVVSNATNNITTVKLEGVVNK